MLKLLVTVIWYVMCVVAHDVAFDANNRVAFNYLLFTEGCPPQTSNPEVDRCITGIMTPSDAQHFGFTEDCDCQMVWLNKGTSVQYLYNVLPHERYDCNEEESIPSWLDKMRTLEIGWVSLIPNEEFDIYWIGSEGPILVQKLQYGERHTVWLETVMGHKFDVRYSSTGQLYQSYIVEVNSFHVVGERVWQAHVMEDLEQHVNNTLSREYDRANAIQRTFTPLGFSKGKLPIDLYSSMLTYHYNNVHSMYLEEWRDAQVHINWWEVPVSMIGMPWALKGYWQTRLKTLVEEWTGGIPLENTDIYGIRRYEDGARLLTHVDREATHAVSLIINVGQGGMREPWHVEIYDFAGRLHEIPMEPGDIVYYESARCLHGRMKPLEGAYYDNLFSHYRPVGDPEWFTRENPADTPPQLLDVGECRVDGSGNAVCDGAHLPYLSPQLEKVTGPGDLFQYWRKVSPTGGFGSRDEL